MPIDPDDVEPELTQAEEAFRRGGQEYETGLDISNAELVQLRKACRSLSGADRLLVEGYYTLAIEAAFTSIEKTLLFWLIQEGYHDPSQPPQSHTTAIKQGAEVGFLDDEVATRIVDLWTTNRAQTYYQDALPSWERADSLTEIATRIHDQIVSLARVSHECVCD